MNEKNQTNQEQTETQKLAKLYTTQLAEKMFEAHKKFRDKNNHLEKIFLHQIMIGANKIQLQTYIAELLTWSKKEDRQEHFKALMKNFEKEIFDAVKFEESKRNKGKS